MKYFILIYTICCDQPLYFDHGLKLYYDTAKYFWGKKSARSKYYSAGWLLIDMLGANLGQWSEAAAKKETFRRWVEQLQNSDRRITNIEDWGEIRQVMKTLFHRRYFHRASIRRPWLQFLAIHDSQPSGLTHAEHFGPRDSQQGHFCTGKYSLDLKQKW